MLATAVFSLASALAAIAWPGVAHWSLAFITISGIICGVGAADWLRGAVDLFSPRAVVAVFGIHFFYLAPLLHLGLGRWPRYVEGAADWPTAMGTMAALNTLGLVAFAVASRLRLGPERTPLTMDRARFVPAALLVVFVGLGAWLLVAARFGGAADYLSALFQDRADLTGFGGILILAESWPLLLLVAVLVARSEDLRRRPGLHLLVFVAFVALLLFAGGLRGSRALVVWPLFIALVASHLLVRPVSRRMVAGVAVALVAFSWGYGFYKSVGADIARYVTGELEASSLAEETGRDLTGLLLGDFGRADVQALVLDRLATGSRVAFGESYVGDLCIFLPELLCPGEPRDKVAIGTEVLHGATPDYLGGRESSRIYGLAGEAMLNFGPLGVVAAYALYGRLVARADRYYTAARLDPARLPQRVLAATLPAAAVLLLVSDLDNLILFLLKYVVLIAAVVAWSSALARARPAAPTIALGRQR